MLLALLSALKRVGTPKTVEEIESRVIELAVCANFMREMRMFAHAADFSSPTFLALGRLERRLQNMRFHMVDSSELASLERTEIKLLAHGGFLALLRRQGSERAAQWLSAHSGDVGKRSSVDVRKWFS